MELETSVYRPNVAVYDSPDGVEVRGRYDQVFAKILTRDALGFVAELQREFRGHVRYAMECRREAKRRYNSGAVPGFDPSTKFIRDGEWVCASVPPSVADRRVEITGPVERKMIINALNSGAKVFMVHFLSMSLCLCLLIWIRFVHILCLCLNRQILRTHCLQAGRI